MSFLEIQTSKHFLSRKFSRYTRVKKISAHIFCLYGPVRPKKINGFSRSKEFNQGVGCTRNFKANFTNALIGLILSKNCANRRVEKQLGAQIFESRPITDWQSGAPAKFHAKHIGWTAAKERQKFSE